MPRTTKQQVINQSVLQPEFGSFSYSKNLLQEIEAVLKDYNYDVDDDVLDKILTQYFAVTTKLKNATETEQSGALNWSEFMQQVQTYPEARVVWFKTLFECMKNSNFYDRTKWIDVARFLVFKELIGMGGYGNVKKAVWKKDNCSLLPVAVKIQDTHFNSKAEAFCSQAANMLVLKGICNHFVLSYPSLIVKNDEKIELDNDNQIEANKELIVTVMEYADGDIRGWLEENDDFTSGQIISILFQALVGVLYMITEYDAVHGDLYLHNMLYSNTKQSTFNYTIPLSKNSPLQFKYSLKSQDKLLKLADFGFCESQKEKDALKPNQDDKFKKFESWADSRDNPFIHISLYTDVPRYACDVLSVVLGIYRFLYSKQSRRVKHYRVLKYLDRIGGLLEKAIFSGSLKTQTGFCHLFHHIFRRDFMGDNLADEARLEAQIEKK